MKSKMWVNKAIMLGAMSVTCSLVFATEGGGSIYPNGTENYTVGAMPPPGVYILEYLSSYSANRFQDNNGNQTANNFRLNVSAMATRVIWVTDQQILGGQLSFHTIAPLVNIGVSVQDAGQTKSGLGDMTIGAGLGYHVSDKLHYVLGFDINAPTGAYNKNDMVNLGRNYWNLEPLAAISYIQADGINADLKVMYDVNATNTDTNYKSGQELHADYALGWGFGKNFVAGLGGYIYQQMTNDTQNGATIQNNRGRAMAIGPSIKYDSGKGWFLTAKYQKEFEVRNRPEGGGLNVKMNIPF